MKDDNLAGCIEIISSLFNFEKDGTTICWNLCQWTDGMWSVKVVDDWHKWVGEKVPELNYKYETPLQACQAFLKYVSDNDIVPSELQEEVDS